MAGRVGDVWAAEWRRTDRSLADLSRHLNAAIASVAPEQGHALDIGSGAGATSLALAAARPALRVTGVDLSAGLVAVARQRAGEGMADRLHFLCDDALACAAEEGPFDLLCSRHGVMFFPEPVAALSALRRSARAGASLFFSCFADRAANGFAMLAEGAIGDVGSPDTGPDTGYAPGPFAFANRDRVATWLERAGWRPESAARVEFDYVVGEGDDPVADALSFLSRIGPAARALTQAAAPDRERIASALRHGLERYRTGDHIVLPGSAWIWRATA